MAVLLNGAFGVGKTTVARRLVRLLSGSLLFDPEVIGFALRRLPSFLPLRGRGTSDYQDPRSTYRRRTAQPDEIAAAIAACIG